jgi:hypothetical protein
MSRPFGSVRRFVPRLDCLDDRALPSATVTAIDGVVVVRGDSSGNTIRVFDNGTRDVGNVVVEVDGQRLDFDTPVDEVRINGGGGGDSVRYDLTTDLNSDRLVTVNLGNGRDSFTAEMRGDVGEDVDLEVRVNGGNGQDNIRLLAADVTTRAGATMADGFHGGRRERQRPAHRRRGRGPDQRRRTGRPVVRRQRGRQRRSLRGGHRSPHDGELRRGRRARPGHHYRPRGRRGRLGGIGVAPRRREATP